MSPKKGPRTGSVRPGGSLVLDSAGLAGLAVGDAAAREAARQVLARGGRIVVAATTLTEVLRGSRRDAAIHRVLMSATVEPVDEAVARQAGERLGASGLDGHRCTMDPVVAVVALNCERPVLLLTSDVDDLSALTEEPERAKNERISVHRV